MDPKKFGVLFLLVYAAIWTWVLPPVEQLRRPPQPEEGPLEELAVIEELAPRRDAPAEGDAGDASMDEIASDAGTGKKVRAANNGAAADRAGGAARPKDPLPPMRDRPVGILKLTIVDAESGEPVERGRVALAASKPLPEVETLLHDWSQRKGSTPLEASIFGARGARTDQGGQLEVRVPAGLGYKLLCGPAPGQETLLKPLRKDERRRIQVELTATEAPAEEEPGREAPVAEGGQEPAPAEGAPRTEPSPIAERLGKLTVRVVAEGTEQPLTTARVRVEPARAGEAARDNLRTWANTVQVPTREAQAFTPEGAAVDADGTLLVHLPPGFALELICYREGTTDEQRIGIDAFQKSEQREVRVELAPGMTIPFWGRVVAAADGAPLADCEIRSGGRPLATTMPDGTFDLTIDPGAQEPLGVVATGFEPALLEPVAGHETLETALLIELASEGGSVADLAAPVEAAAPVEPEPEPETMPATAVAAPDRAAPTAAPDAAGVRGRVVDQTGAPVAAAEVWLVAPWSEVDRVPRRLERHDRIRGETRTAADGSFRFHTVPLGEWLVGTAAPPAESDTPWNERVSSVALPVAVTQARYPGEVLLEVGRGLTVRGGVLAPDATPAARLTISAIEEGIAGRVTTRTSADGVFVLGPLGPGPCRVMALGGSTLGDQEFGPFEPGDEGVLLELSAGCVLTGQVFDGVDGPPLQSRLDVLRPYANPPRTQRAVTSDGGQFRVEGLERRVYCIVATTDDGRLAISENLDLTLTGAIHEVRLAALPGGRLALRNRLPGGAVDAVFLHDGRPFAVERLERGASVTQTTPTGEIVVRLLGPEGDALTERVVEVTAGALVPLELE